MREFRQKYCFVLLVLLVLPLSAADQSAETLVLNNQFRVTIQRVSESVYMISHDYGANLACVALPDGLVFVDCGMHTGLARALRAEMEKRLKKPVQALVLTHCHLDHVLAMDAFRDVKVIAAQSSRELLKKQMAIEFTPPRIQAYGKTFKNFAESVKDARLFMPTHWFSDTMTLGRGRQALVIKNSGGHSRDSSWIFFPAEKIVFAGDLIQQGQYPYFGDPTTDMDCWINTLKQWETMDVKKLCPGHGKAVNREFARSMRDYFTAVRAKVRELKKQGVSIRQAVRHPELPSGYWDKNLPRPVWFDYCIARVYMEKTR